MNFIPIKIFSDQENEGLLSQTTGQDGGAGAKAGDSGVGRPCLLSPSNYTGIINGAHRQE